MRMKAIAISKHGDTDVLTWQDLEEPVLMPHTAIVKVHAVSVNHLDIWVRKGLPHLKLTYPHVLGSDIAGEIHQIDPIYASRYPLGQKVLINPGLSCMHCEVCLSGHDNLCQHYGILGEHHSGGLCTRIRVPVHNLVPLPDDTNLIQAAALPITYLTAWQMLIDKARLQAGQTVFIHALGSGVGMASLQIAKLMGAHVIGSASTEDKRQKARTMGADVVLDSHRDMVTEVKKITHKRGVDVVVEHTGQSTFKSSILMAAKGGVIVTCGATSGFTTEVDLRHIFFRQVSILGSTMGPKSALFKIVSLMQTGQFSPVIDSVLPFEQVAQAHNKLEQRQVFGKIVLVPAQ